MASTAPKRLQEDGDICTQRCRRLTLPGGFTAFFIGVYSSSDPEPFLFLPRPLPAITRRRDKLPSPTDSVSILFCGGVVPLGVAADFLEPVSESESQMDLSGFFAFAAGIFLGLGAAPEGF